MISDGSTPASTILKIAGLKKSFGALRATDDVTLNVLSGELHALIGPNGAGKSTLIGLICGELLPDAGQIVFDGRDVTALRTPMRARLGIGRSFQITQLCSDFSASENVLLAMEAADGGSFNMLSNPRKNARNRRVAHEWLERVGLGHHADRSVSTLAHGEKRQLELAVVLALRPKLLLLDEPMAGMGPEESAALVRLLTELKGECAILLVEHDMDAVFALADRVSVLVYGRTIFTGTPEEIRAHPEVRAAYLGEEPAC